MIKIGFVEIEEDLLDGKRKGAQGFFAHLLLKELYKSFNVGEMPDIIRKAEKKPYFANGGLFFNISHDASLAAVAVSDEGEIGIDIQSMPERLISRGKIEKRLLESLDRQKLSHEPLIYGEPLIFKAKGGDVSLFSEKCVSYKCQPDMENSDFLEGWTALEALLKLYGGFVFLADAEKLCSTTVEESFWVSDSYGKKYSVTVARKI